MYEVIISPVIQVNALVKIGSCYRKKSDIEFVPSSCCYVNNHERCFKMQTCLHPFLSARRDDRYNKEKLPVECRGFSFKI